MLSLRTTIKRGIRGESGVTLVELLVAMTAGIVVIGALFSIMEASLTQTARITNETYANQLGRTAMAKIVTEMHTACISPGYTPVVAGSTADELIFRDAVGEEAVLQRAYEHRIVWNSAARTLTDYAYPSNGGSWPNFTFSKTATSTTQLATRVSELESGGEPVPIFRYYKYATAASGAETSKEAVSTLESTPLSTPLSSEGAATAASVAVSFEAAASDAGRRLETPVPLTAQVTFAFSAPNVETPIQDSPCR